MKKFEIVHGPLFLNALEELEKANIIPGYTTFTVHSGSGPIKGNYMGDHLTDDQYYSFIIMDAEADHLIKKIEDVYKGGRVSLLTSEIDCRPIN